MAKFSSHFLPVFNPVAGTLDFSAVPLFNVRQLYAVVDSTANVPLYLQGIGGYGYSSLVNGVMMLQAPLTGCAASDTLAVTYDDGNDQLTNLYSLFSQTPDTTNANAVRLIGAYVQDQKTQETLRFIKAALVTLCRITAHANGIPDGDVDAMMNDELQNSDPS
jgi:hypothetical protein